MTGCGYATLPGRHRAGAQPHPRAQAPRRMDIRTDEPQLRGLMLAGLDGDAAAHTELLTKLGAHLRAYFKKRLAGTARGPADAEDLVQETLIAIHTRRHTYDPTQLLTPWVYAIARYRLVDYLRRTKTAEMDVPIEGAAEVMAAEDTSAVRKRARSGRAHGRAEPQDEASDPVGEARRFERERGGFETRHVAFGDQGLGSPRLARALAAGQAKELVMRRSS